MHRWHIYINNFICKDDNICIIFIYLKKKKVKYKSLIKCSLYPISLVSIPVCEWQPVNCCVDTMVILIWLRLASPHPFAFIFPIFFLFLQIFSIIFSCFFVILLVTRLTRPSWINKLVFGEEWSWTDDHFSVYLIFCVEAVKVAITMLHTKQSEGSNLGHGLHKLNFTSLAPCAVYIL